MIRSLTMLLAMVTFLIAYAENEKSFSKQMNELKRSGDYVYAEASAPSESDAKSACDALIKIEVSKFLASQNADTGNEIVKNISNYNRKYLVQPRGDMTRAFGYIAKTDIAAAGNITPVTRPQPSVETAVKEEPVKEEPVSEENITEEEEMEAEGCLEAGEDDVAAETASAETPAETPVETSAKTVSTSRNELNTAGLNLAKWQIDMLTTVAAAPDMAAARKTLNRYKSQNRVKRIGDNNTANPRPADTYYLIFSGSGGPKALLTPASGKEHTDMLSGSTSTLDSYAGAQYLWFQISK